MKLYAHRDKESNMWLADALGLTWPDVKHVGGEIELLYEVTGATFKLVGVDGFFLDSDQRYTSGDVDLDEADER